VRDREDAERDLANFKSDLALVFEPVHMVDLEVLMRIPQVIHAIHGDASTPWAVKPEVRLRGDCLDQPPCRIPSRRIWVRAMLDDFCARGHARGAHRDIRQFSSSFAPLRYCMKTRFAIPNPDRLNRGTAVKANLAPTGVT